MKLTSTLLASLALAGPGLAQCPETLSVARGGASGTAVGDVLLFAGGNGGGAYSASVVVDLYHVSTGSWTSATLAVARYSLAATSAGGLAFFAGGGRFSQTFQYNLYDTVDVYDAAGESWSVMQLSQHRMFLAGTSVAGRALFAGGISTGAPPFGMADRVDIYDTQTASWSTAQLSQPRANLAAASAGGLALFAGGVAGPGQIVATVDLYDSATGLWSTAQLSAPRMDLAATSVGSLVIFAGGSSLVASQLVPSDVVDIYDTASGLWTVEQLSVARTRLSAVSLGDRALFAGGLAAGDQLSAVVEVRDTNGWSTLLLGEARRQLAAAGGAGEAILAGGYTQSGTHSADAERFTLGFPRSYCFGDGSGSVCPCGNPGGPGAGCANSSGMGASLAASGCNALGADSLILRVGDLPAGTPALLFGALNATAAGAGGSFGDGLRCAGSGIVRLGVRSANASGQASWGPGLIAQGGWSAGDLRRFQSWYRDPGGPCGSGFNLSNGVEIGFAP